MSHGVPPKTDEQAVAYLADLDQADALLARHVGPKHTVRVELARLRGAVQQQAKDTLCL